MRLSCGRTTDDRGVLDHALTKPLNETVRVPPRLNDLAVAHGDPVACVFTLYLVAGHGWPFPVLVDLAPVKRIASFERLRGIPRS